jgi:hypothetical protein
MVFPDAGGVMLRAAAIWLTDDQDSNQSVEKLLPVLTFEPEKQLGRRASAIKAYRSVKTLWASFLAMAPGPSRIHESRVNEGHVCLTGFWKNNAFKWEAGLSDPRPEFGPLSGRICTYMGMYVHYTVSRAFLRQDSRRNSASYQCEKNRQVTHFFRPR